AEEELRMVCGALAEAEAAAGEAREGRAEAEAERREVQTELEGALARAVEAEAAARGEAARATREAEVSGGGREGGGGRPAGGRWEPMVWHASSEAGGKGWGRRRRRRSPDGACGLVEARAAAREARQGRAEAEAERREVQTKLEGALARAGEAEAAARGEAEVSEGLRGEVRTEELRRAFLEKGLLDLEMERDVARWEWGSEHLEMLRAEKVGRNREREARALGVRLRALEGAPPVGELSPTFEVHVFFVSAEAVAERFIMTSPPWSPCGAPCSDCAAAPHAELRWCPICRGYHTCGKWTRLPQGGDRFTWVCSFHSAEAAEGSAMSQETTKAWAQVAASNDEARRPVREPVALHWAPMADVEDVEEEDDDDDHVSPTPGTSRACATLQQEVTNLRVQEAARSAWRAETEAGARVEAEAARVARAEREEALEEARGAAEALERAEGEPRRAAREVRSASAGARPVGGGEGGGAMCVARGDGVAVRVEAEAARVGAREEGGGFEEARAVAEALERRRGTAGRRRARGGRAVVARGPVGGGERRGAVRVARRTEAAVRVEAEAAG
ncbi:hypothetical protein CYMTET_33886, partial [Cymbomonas tetramitiformis]